MFDPDFTPLKQKLGEEFFDKDDSSEDEGMPDYKLGGYHPIHVGEILVDRYVIIQKLGWGHFSTVWLTKDLKFNSYVAIKVQKSAQHYLEAAYDEVDILHQVATNWKSEEWKKAIHISGEDLEIFEKALDCQFDSNMESDQEMLQGAIDDGDWEFAESLIKKFQITDRAFKLLKTLKALGESK